MKRERRRSIQQSLLCSSENPSFSLGRGVFHLFWIFSEKSSLFHSQLCPTLTLGRSSFSTKCRIFIWTPCGESFPSWRLDIIQSSLHRNRVSLEFLWNRAALEILIFAHGCVPVCPRAVNRPLAFRLSLKYTIWGSDAVDFPFFFLIFKNFF